jgi:hypothetical protein
MPRDVAGVAGDQLKIRCKDHDVTSHVAMLMSFPLRHMELMSTLLKELNVER